MTVMMKVSMVALAIAVVAHIVVWLPLFSNSRQAAYDEWTINYRLFDAYDKRARTTHDLYGTFGTTYRDWQDQHPIRVDWAYAYNTTQGFLPLIHASETIRARVRDAAGPLSCAFGWPAPIRDAVEWVLECPSIEERDRLLNRTVDWFRSDIVNYWRSALERFDTLFQDHFLTIRQAYNATEFITEVMDKTAFVFSIDLYRSIRDCMNRTAASASNRPNIPIVQQLIACFKPNTEYANRIRMQRAIAELRKANIPDSIIETRLNATNVLVDVRNWHTHLVLRCLLRRIQMQYNLEVAGLPSELQAGFEYMPKPDEFPSGMMENWRIYELNQSIQRRTDGESPTLWKHLDEIEKECPP
jgi:hypothetical protein